MTAFMMTTYQFTCPDCGAIEDRVCFPHICVPCECGKLMFIKMCDEEEENDEDA